MVYLAEDGGVSDIFGDDQLGGDAFAVRISIGRSHMTAPHDLTLRLAQLTSLACSVTAAIYVVAQVEPAPVMETAMAYAPTLAVILWLQKDAAQTGAAVRLDWGLFLCWLWLGLIPWYARKTRGRAGWRLAAGLFGLIAAPYISAILARLLASYFA